MSRPRARLHGGAPAVAGLALLGALASTSPPAATPHGESPPTYTDVTAVNPTDGVRPP